MTAIIDFWDTLALDDPRPVVFARDAELHGRLEICVRACFLTLTAAAQVGPLRTGHRVGGTYAVEPPRDSSLAAWASTSHPLPQRPALALPEQLRSARDAVHAERDARAAAAATEPELTIAAEPITAPTVGDLAQALEVSETVRLQLVDDLATAHKERATALATAKRTATELDTLRAELAAARAKHENDLDSLRRTLAEERLDAHTAHDARRDAEATLRALQKRLVAAGWYDQANEPVVAETDPVPQPVNFLALVEQAEQYAALGIHLTGTPRERERLARLLDEHDTTGDAAAQAWETFLALADYRRAKHDGGFTGNLYNYLETPPIGYRTVGLAKFASNESAATMTAYGHEREFAVPKHVFASGTVRMTAHFRLGRVGGMNAPRLHLFDHTAPSTAGECGDVYVGYIGPHLRNRGTN